MVFVKSLRAATLLLFAHALLAQHSQWVHPGADGHLIYGRDKSGAVRRPVRVVAPTRVNG